jgi:hypothetical protein
MLSSPDANRGIALRKTSRKAPGHTHCRYCNRRLSTLEHYAGDCCSTPRCKEQQLQEQLEAYRKGAAQRVNEPAPERFSIVVVPHRESSIVPIEPERRRTLEDRLTELAAECAGKRAATARPPAEAPVPVPAVCSSCHGACCYHGGQHAAFLDEDTIGAYAAEHPGLTANEITAAYLQHVPDLHFAGSCVFHTNRGCNLPRSMRAPICNLYECRGLKMARELGNGSHPALFVVVRHDNVIVRGEFVDESRDP